MNPHKMTARMVGAFYIAATVAGIVGLAFSDPIVGASDYLTKISAHENQVLIGALFELIMAVAVAGIAIAVYPVLRQRNASIAVGYVGARIVESMLFLIGVISLLLLVTLSHEFVKAGSPEGSYFHTIGELLLAVRDWGGHVVLDVAVFPLGALIFYSLLYQFRLVPRWVSGWGLIGAVLYWSAGVLVMFDLIETLSTPQIALQAPLGLQEIALALWLIVRGFNTSAIAAETVEA
jgi:hypothetical protein